ncbi:MAG: lipopolysaccharide heptosyltransferase I, partial [Xanthobacteraceae bacterium]
HHMPALTEARRHMPDAKFSWLVEDAFVPLVKLHPAVNEVIPVSARRWRRQILSPRAWGSIGAFVRRLRANTYDKIIDTQGLLRSGIMTKIAHGERNGYDVASVREKMAARFYDVHYNVPRDLHAVRRNRLLTGLALGYDVKGPPDYGLDRGGLAIVSAKPYAVLLHATAERRKEWPEENWIALARALEEHVDVLLPWGSDAEHKRAERIASQLKRTVVPIRRELDDMARMIAGASFVVGVDTGLLHLAAALAVPLVGIFIGSEPGLTGPTGSGPIEVVGSKGAAPSADAVIAAAQKLIP